MHIDKKKKVILFLGNGPEDGLGDATSTAEAEYSINLSKQQNIFLGYTIMEITFFQLKARESELNAYPLYLGSISKNLQLITCKKLDHVDTCMILQLITMILVLMIF